MHRNLLRIILAAALAGITSTVQAAERISSPDLDGQTVAISDAPCALPVPPQMAPHLKHAALRDRAGTMLFTGCWFRREGVVMILWSDGDRDSLPESSFDAPGKDA